MELEEHDALVAQPTKSQGEFSTNDSTYTAYVIYLLYNYIIILFCSFSEFPFGQKNVMHKIPCSD